MTEINIDRLMQAMSEIMTDKYGLQITFSAVPKKKEEIENGHCA